MTREPLFRTNATVAKIIFAALIIAVALVTLSACGDPCGKFWTC